MTYTRKIHGKANIRRMSIEERRAYNRERAAEYRMRRALFGEDQNNKPEIWSCNACKKEWPFTEQYFTKNDRSAFGLRKICKDCTSAKQRVGYYKHYYGLSDEQARTMTENGCQICGNTQGIVIDHDHNTGKIRGGLCNGCNTGLGSFKDNPARLRAAALYLELQGP